LGEVRLGQSRGEYLRQILPDDAAGRLYKSCDVYILPRRHRFNTLLIIPN
jgi:hypothetical protein